MAFMVTVQLAENKVYRRVGMVIVVMRIDQYKSMDMMLNRLTMSHPKNPNQLELSCGGIINEVESLAFKADDADDNMSLAIAAEDMASDAMMFDDSVKSGRSS